jgi:hypothetical protein
VVFDESELDEFLKHFGVKGMHWGVRETRSTSLTPTAAKRAELADLNKKISKIGGQKYVDGEELRGWALKKQYKKAVKKDPSFTYGKLTPEAKAEWQKRATRKVTRSLITRGVIETAVVLGGGTLGVNAVHLNKESKVGAEIAVILLAGHVGTTRVSELRSVHQASKFKQYDLRRDELNKQLAPKKTKKGGLNV